MDWAFVLVILLSGVMLGWSFSLMPAPSLNRATGVIEVDKDGEIVSGYVLLPFNSADVSVIADVGNTVEMVRGGAWVSYRPVGGAVGGPWLTLRMATAGLEVVYEHGPAPPGAFREMVKEVLR